MYIYAAPDFSCCHTLLKPGFVTWVGTLGHITPAVTTGVRRGMHSDPAVRPPFAEIYDYKDASVFLHVLGLRQLTEAIPFDRFRDADGAKLFGRFAPSWIARGRLAKASEPVGVPLLRAA